MTRPIRGLASQARAPEHDGVSTEAALNASTGPGVGPEIVDKILTGALEVARASAFEHCRFERCLLQAAELTRCEFVGCRFNGCNLAAARLLDCELRDAVFVDCKLSGVDWTAARRVERVSFENCVLDDAAFLGMKMHKTSFRGSRLRNAILAEADLSDADLSGCDLAGARFAGAKLLRADLRGAKGYSINPLETRVAGMRVSWPEGLALLAALGVDVQM
jgi:uncharacterized protein YjbI with pentapeptide repeats